MVAVLFLPSVDTMSFNFFISLCLLNYLMTYSDKEDNYSNGDMHPVNEMSN